MHLNYIPRGPSVSEDALRYCGDGFTGEFTQDDGTAGLCQARIRQRTNTPRKRNSSKTIFEWKSELETRGNDETCSVAHRIWRGNSSPGGNHQFSSVRFPMIICSCVIYAKLKRPSNSEFIALSITSGTTSGKGQWVHS
jgi:hypothetical protein